MHYTVFNSFSMSINVTLIGCLERALQEATVSHLACHMTITCMSTIRAASVGYILWRVAYDDESCELCYDFIIATERLESKLKFELI